MPPAEAGEQARLYRTVAMLAEALERRRQKIAAGIPVEPPVHCPCPECAYAGGTPDAA